MKHAPRAESLSHLEPSACGATAARRIYLNQQGVRLGITQVLVDRARHNQEIYRVQVLLSQLCERYHKARREDGRPVLHQTELAQIRGTLQQAEQECAKLHALAAAAAEMIDEAYRAFDLEQPDRHYAVLCDFDTPQIPLPLGDGTVGDSSPRTGRRRAEAATRKKH